MNCVLFILLPATFYLLLGLQQQYQTCVFCAVFPAIFSIRLQVYIKIWYDFSCNIQPLNCVVLFIQPFSPFIYRSLYRYGYRKKIVFCLFFSSNFVFLLIGLLISKSDCVFLIYKYYCCFKYIVWQSFLRYLD